MQTIKLSTKGHILIPNEIRPTSLPIFPVTSVEEVAGLLAKVGTKKSSESTTREKIAKAIKAHDAATRK